MLNAPASGCGPGISRPADTQQEGVRSVRARDTDESFSRLFVLAHLTINLLKGHDSDFAALARGFQECADIAMQLHAAHAAQGGGRCLARISCANPSTGYSRT